MDPLSLGLMAGTAALSYFGREKDREVADANYAAQQAANENNFRLAVQARQDALDRNAQLDQQWERSYASSLSQFDRNMAKQEEFAKMGIQWKVADAVAAGLHPLYALGGGASYSPSAVVGASTGSSVSVPTPRIEAAVRQGRSSASNLAAMGQDITGAILRSESAEAKAYTRSMQALSLEKAGLENDYLRSQIAQSNSQASAAVGFPSGTAAPGVVEQPLKITVPAPANAGQEPGGIPGLGYDVSEHGGMKYYYPIPSKDVKERIEDMHGPEFMWALRNNYLPSIGLYRSPPAHVPLEAGNEWFFHPMLGYYQKPPRKWIRRLIGY